MTLTRPKSRSGAAGSPTRDPRGFRAPRTTMRTLAFSVGLASAALAAPLSACGPLRDGNALTGTTTATTATTATHATANHASRATGEIATTASIESTSATLSIAKADLPAKARKVLDAVNTRRERRGLRPLRYDSRLGAAAHGFAREMAARDFFAHFNPEGVAPEERISAKGYPWVATAENIAYGNASPEEIVDGWMRSPAHRANMLDPLYTEMGAGYAANSNSRYQRFWVINFGKPARGR